MPETTTGGIFLNEEQSILFRKNGYFTMPLMDADACNKLYTLLSSQQLKQDAAFRFSIKSDNTEYKKTILNILQQFFTDQIKNICSGYKLSRAVYLEKDTGENSYVAMHTDDCSCDETKYVPFHIWIPLVDTNKQNGCICVVKGSHTATNIIRGIQIPQHHYQHQQTLLEKYLTPLENKAGEALIYHPGLLHYSYPNLSKEMRPAIVAAFIPEEAQNLVYFKRNKWYDKSLLEYEMTAEQYCYWNEKEEPSTHLLRKIKNLPYKDISPDFLKIIEYANT